MHEMFCLHVGQCGLQIGFALWELLSAEHNINRDGKLNSSTEPEDGSYQSFFNLSMAGQYVPKGLFVDLEPTIIDQMKTGAFASLYHPDQLVSGSEDAANNFARGFHTVGRIMRYACENRIRREFEVSNRIQGIHIYRSLGGGTGSGMTATIFEILVEYAKIGKIEIPIHPSPHLSCAIVEPYNSILSEHFCMEDIDISFLIDNEALYDIATTQMFMKAPTFHNINRLVAQVCSSVTASARFENELSNDFTSLTNLVPYPRIHFPLVSYAPFGSESQMERNPNTVSEMTHQLFHVSNQLVKCDPESGKYMSCSIVYRGKISPTEVYSTLSEIKSSRHIRFVDWCPTGFKIGIIDQPPQIIPESKIGYTDKNAVMMTNNSSVSSIWHRLAQKFHRLYAKRSFVHWFVSEGLEESEFCESLYNIATLAKDYEEVALNTEWDDTKMGTPQVGEGEGKGEGKGEGLAAEGEGVNQTKKSTGGGSKTADKSDDDDDDDDDDNENASNASEIKNKISNNNKTLNWCNQFESLIKSLYETDDLSSLKYKSTLSTSGTKNAPCTDLCVEKNKRELREMIENYNVSNNGVLKSTMESNNYVDVSNNRNDNNHSCFCCNIDHLKKLQAIICKNKQEMYESNIMSLHDDTMVSCTSGLSMVTKDESLDFDVESNSSFTGNDFGKDELEMFSMMDELVRITSLD